MQTQTESSQCVNTADAAPTMIGRRLENLPMWYCSRTGKGGLAVEYETQIGGHWRIGLHRQKWWVCVRHGQFAKKGNRPVVRMFKTPELAAQAASLLNYDLFLLERFGETDDETA